MSTARIEPPAARHVPTLTLTGAAEPDIALMEPVVWKLGKPLVEMKVCGPVLMTATKVSELSGGTAVGAVTPGNPATFVQVPIGRIKPPVPVLSVGGVLPEAGGGVVDVGALPVEFGEVEPPDVTAARPLTAADAAKATHEGAAGADDA